MCVSILKRFVRDLIMWALKYVNFPFDNCNLQPSRISAACKKLVWAKNLWVRRLTPQIAHYTCTSKLYNSTILCGSRGKSCVYQKLYSYAYRCLKYYGYLSKNWFTSIAKTNIVAIQTSPPNRFLTVVLQILKGKPKVWCPIFYAESFYLIFRY